MVKRNNSKTRLRRLTGTLLLVACLAGTAAHGAELKMADQFPASHIITQEGTQEVIMQSIEKLLEKDSPSLEM